MSGRFKDGGKFVIGDYGWYVVGINSLAVMETP